MALLVGLGVVPAVLVVLADKVPASPSSGGLLLKGIQSLVGYRRTVLCVSLVALSAGGWGLTRLRSEINPLAFLPPASKVAHDYTVLEASLNGLAPIEAVVDFSDGPASFTERLAKVRILEARIASHPTIHGTLSLADFFPTERPSGLRGLLSLGSLALEEFSPNSLLSDDGRLRRITAWGPAQGRWQFGPLLDELRGRVAGEPVTFTGIVPLLNFAQHEIFLGFWKSFLLALGVIAVVMTIGLRSAGYAVVALVPNLTPVVLVFGFLPLADIPVDIGTMMTASIALGFAVDNKLHFLGCFRTHYEAGLTSSEAVQRALAQCGRPMPRRR